MVWHSGIASVTCTSDASSLMDPSSTPLTDWEGNLAAWARALSSGPGSAVTLTICAARRAAAALLLQLLLLGTI